MATVVLDAYSKGYPFITNRIKASVLSATSPFAVVASIIDTTVGHPQRIYHFPGLPRNNYGFSLDEIDGAGLVVQNLALFSIVPASIDGLLTRKDEQIRVGTTPGLVAGTTQFVFDGTETSPGSGIFKPDYIGWDIIPYEIGGGRQLMIAGVDYQWDKVTGTFDLLIAGDAFADMQYYDIRFNAVQQAAGNSYPTVTDFGINLITISTNLDESFFGKKLICEPAGDYIEVTLPDINTVVDGRKMMVEVSDIAHKCVKFVPFGAEVIKWLRGNLMACGSESFSIYKFSRPGLDPEWRVCETDGNFKKVGQSTSDDVTGPDAINKLLLDGSSVDIQKYARLYEEFVLQLDAGQVVNYDAWSTGNNKYFFSLANSANPANANKFMIPDRRDLFERNNKTGKAGDWFNWNLAEHYHFVFNTNSSTGTNPIGADKYAMFQNEQGGIGDFKYTIAANGTEPTVCRTSKSGSGTEVYPKHYLINKYVLI